MRRVVVTGYGSVNPVGLNAQESFTNILEGACGVDLISRFDPKDLPVHIAAEVKAENFPQFFDAKELRKTTRYVQMAVAAATEAMEQAKITPSIARQRFGTSIGVGMGALYDIEANAHVLRDKGPKRVSPFFIPYAIPNMGAGVVSLRFNLQGPNICTTTACASGTHGIGEAFHMIRGDRADLMLAGGAEAVISPLGIASFAAMKALSRHNHKPNEASRPFDLDRDGFVMGEGCGLLVLEELDHALARGADIYAEMVGYGATADAHHITAPAPEHEGGARCMQAALDCAAVPYGSVDYINAHGTSTRLNDLYETTAIKNVFKEHSRKLAISSTKGATGHCIGAAGGIEAVIAVQAIENQVLPPTVNLKNPDPECDLDYVAEGSRKREVNYALSNSFGFGGTNGSLLFKRYV